MIAKKNTNRSTNGRHLLLQQLMAVPFLVFLLSTSRSVSVSGQAAGGYGYNNYGGGYDHRYNNNHGGIYGGYGMGGGMGGGAYWSPGWQNGGGYGAPGGGGGNCPRNLDPVVCFEIPGNGYRFTNMCEARNAGFSEGQCRREQQTNLRRPGRPNNGGGGGGAAPGHNYYPSNTSRRLVATVGRYPGYQGYNSNVRGTVTVEFDDRDGGLRYTYDLSGVEGNCRDCGAHIHSGRSCDRSDLVGSHHWNEASYLGSDDPWMASFGAVYRSDYNGGAAGSFDLYTGYGFSENRQRTVVIHAKDGTQIGCGVLY